MSCRGCLAAGLPCLLVGLLAGCLFTLCLGHLLTSTDSPAPADAIVVLGGGSPARARHAVRLFEGGYAPRVVFSGGRLYETGLACSSAHLSLEAAEALGLPAGAAVIADEAQSTYDEAVNLARLAGQQGWRSLILVTEPLHTRRAARTFRALLPGTRVYVSAAPEPGYDPARWWASEDGLAMAIDEVLKLGFYWAHYGIRPF